MQPILYLLLMGGGGEGSIQVKSRSCSKAVPTLQHTIYGKQNKKNRKIGFEHYGPERIITHASCSVQGLPWAPSAFKAKKGNVELEQQPESHCLPSNSAGLCLHGEVCTCGRRAARRVSGAAGRVLGAAGAPALCPLTVSSSQSRAQGQTLGAALLLLQHLQAAPTWDGSKCAPSHPSNRSWAISAEEGPDSAGEEGTGTSETGTLSFQPVTVATGGTAPHRRLNEQGRRMHTRPLRPGIPAAASRGQAAAPRPGPPAPSGRSSSCRGRASPSPPFPPGTATPTLQELYRKSPGRADCQLT